MSAMPIFSGFQSCPQVHSRNRSFTRSRNRKGLCLLLAAFALLAPALLLSPAHAARNATAPESEESPEALVRQMDPFGWNLSPDAELLYYYLLLSDGLAENSRLTVDTALKHLLKLDPSLPVFQDSVTILLSRGEFANAEKLALTGLKRFPDDALLTLLLSGVHNAKGREAKAAGLLEDYLKRNPGAREVTEELVRLYLQMGQGEKAAKIIAELPGSDQTPDGELFRAKVLFTVGRAAEAQKLLRELLEKKPDFYDAWEELGSLHLQEKNLGEAIKAFEQAARLAPDNPEIWFRIAMVQIERKLPQEAIKAMENASTAPELYVQTALQLADRNFFKEAEQMLDLAAQNGANPDEVSLFLSMIKQDSGKNPLDGLEPLESIPPSSDLYPGALQQKIRIYLQAKQYQQAYDTAAEGRKSFPERKELWGLESYALVKLKKMAEAEKLIKKALENFPEDEELLFTLGTMQEEFGKKDDAMKTMESILKVNPRNYQALNYVGYTLADKNTDLERALGLITTALEESPDTDYIVDSLAWVQFRLGRIEEAWNTINRCLSLGGDDPAIWEHYGDIAKAMGKREEALKGYKESIAREPDNIDEVRKKLLELQKK